MLIQICILHADSNLHHACSATATTVNDAALQMDCRDAGVYAPEMAGNPAAQA